MTTTTRLAMFAVLLASVANGCGGRTTPPPPAAEPITMGTEAASTPREDSGLDATALRLLPREVDYVMRVHFGVARDTAFEEIILRRFPLNAPGAERDVEVDILAHTDVVTIGLGEAAVGWVFEGDLEGRFDAIVALPGAPDTLTVTGPAGRRSFGDERTAIGEVGDEVLTVHIPAATAAQAGELPPAVASPVLERLTAALPEVPAGRAILFEAWVAPTWGLLHDLKLVARMTYGAEESDVHVDAILLYPDEEIADERASGWRDFWNGFVEESPESFDGESAVIRRDGATVVLHHELRQLFGEASADERAIMWTLVSLAAHPPNIRFQ